MLKAYIDKTARSHLSELIARAPHEITLVDDPSIAQAIIFENDDPAYIRKTPEYQSFRDKCIVVNEADLPSYFLPACYSAVNKSSWLGKGRTVSIGYLLSEVSVANPFIGEISADAEKRFLYSFRGGATSWVRKRMLKTLSTASDTLIQDSNFYKHWNFDSGYQSEKRDHQKEYADVLSSSAFVLCPRGAGVSSIRLFEVMKAGRVPVILADNWVPVGGIPWHEFALFIPENKISQLDEILRAREADAADMGARAREVWQQYCSPGADAAFLARSIRKLMAGINPRREACIRLVYPFVEAWRKFGMNSRMFLRNLILRVFSLLKIEFPYSLNR